jgi:acetolactate synthase-1/2/3 large subunit
MQSASKQIIEKKTAAGQIARAFRRHGVEVTFGQSLPSAFHMAASKIGLRQAAYREENAGGAMADGYARISNKVAVVTAQNGPAATLLVPPLSEAYKASVPIVALVQEVPRKAMDKNAFQELDQTRLFESCSKWVRRVDEATRIDDYVDTAFTIAATGRPGPVVLLVPVDFLDQSAEAPSTRTVSYGFFPLDRVLPDRARIAEAARLLSEAQAPLIVAGGGVHLSQACSELARLQDSCHLPVATTNMGKGAVDENHPLSLGVVGEFMAEGSRTHNFRKMVRDADVILFVGNRTNQDGPDSWRLFSKQGKIIHNDIDGV